nr:MAG: SWI5-dependent HO expression protein 3 [Bacteriophage sp.]
MPTTFQLVETTFPNGEGKDTQEQINGVYDYLFVLLEQLRYTLFNLDGSNINQNALSKFIKNISEPIYAKIEDTDKNVNELSITAKGLAGRIGDAEGNITHLQATATGLQASISNLNGSVTNLTADVNGIRATVSTKIDATQAQSIFNQSATGFTLSATSGENGTIFKLNYNGAQIASTGSIDLHVKAVNIDGTLTAGALRGGSVSLLAGDTPVGSMDLAYTGTGQVGVGLAATYGGMKMHAAGNIFLESKLGPFALIGKDDASDYPVVSLGGGYLVLSSSYMFGASPPSAAPYGTVFFIEE